MDHTIKDYCNPTYNSWKMMRRRCIGKYKSKGITVSAEWQGSFDKFYRDMGPRPEGKTLDRVDNNGPYEKGNCKWSTPTEQNNNRSDNKRILVNGITRTCAEWARAVGMNYETLKSRLRRGWVIERALINA